MNLMEMMPQVLGATSTASQVSGQLLPTTFAAQIIVQVSGKIKFNKVDLIGLSFQSEVFISLAFQKSFQIFPSKISLRKGLPHSG